MGCLPSVKGYVYTRKFDCAKEYDVGAERWRDITPRYRFNALEKVGNALLKPAEKWYTKWDDTPKTKTHIRVALVAAAVFVVIAGVLGAGLKKVGEMRNPHAKIRAELLQNIRETRKLVYEFTGRVDNC